MDDLLRFPQGVGSDTFNPAPVDHRLSTPKLYAYHAEHSPNHPVFSYTNLATGEIHDITFAEVWRSICLFAEAISSSKFPGHQDSNFKEGGQRPVVGILAIVDSLSYHYLEIALMALGYIPFPLAHNMLVEPIIHLLDNKQVSTLFVSDDLHIQAASKLVSEAFQAKGKVISISPVPRYAAMSNKLDPLALIPADITDDDIEILFHTTGTTGVPKIVPLSKRYMINLSNHPHWGGVDLCGKRVAAHTNPAFYSMGLGTLLWPLSSGAIFALHNPHLPPPLPTPASFLQAWTASKCNIVLCQPVFIDAWARDPQNIPVLQALDALVFSGGNLDKALGDSLVLQGVRLNSIWGSTETGPASYLVPRDPPVPGEWVYFELSPHIKFTMKPHSDNLVEPIWMPTAVSFPAVTNCTIEGTPCYSIGDLWEQHPTQPTRWKVYGRLADQIVLKTGHKINPIPIESILMNDQAISGAVVFGAGRSFPGVILEPSEPISETAEAKEEFIARIWPLIESVNSNFTALQKERKIQREGIILTDLKRPFERTLKGTPRRPVCLALYAEEINTVFKGESHSDQVYEDRR